METDPRIYALAQDAIRDLIADVGRAAIDGRRDELTQRLAEAMQQAMEDEYNALAEELRP